MAKEPTYFMYFPGNYRWSAAFLNMMSLTPYGASEIGELYKIGRMLKDKAPDDDEAWFEACVKVADGVRGHVGLTVDAPIPAVQQFGEKFKKRFNYVCDHNGIKGYTAVYIIKHVTEKMGKFDSKLFAQTLHGMTITPQDEPGVLMEVSFDNNGDLDRESFLGEVVNGKQKIVATLPKLGK